MNATTQIQANTCPKCGAGPGQPCWGYWPDGSGGYVRRLAYLPHLARKTRSTRP